VSAYAGSLKNLKDLKAAHDRLLITEFIKKDSPLLPNPCHFQNNDQSMFQLSSGSEGCSPKMCADEENDDDELRKRPPLDPTAGLCLGSYGGPRGVGVFL